MDTISLHQAGFDSAVASLGTSLTAEHAQLLARYTKDAVIAYDGDGRGCPPPSGPSSAGAGGAECEGPPGEGGKGPGRVHQEIRARGLRPSAGQKREPHRLPAGAAAGRYDLSDDSQRVEFLREATGVIASLHSAVEREIYGGHAAQMAGISAEAMAQEVKKGPPPHPEGKKAAGAAGPVPRHPAPAKARGCATTTSAPPGRRRGAAPDPAGQLPCWRRRRACRAGVLLRCWGGFDLLRQPCGRGTEHPAARPGRGAGAGGDGPPGLGGRAAGKSGQQLQSPGRLHALIREETRCSGTDEAVC